MINKVKDIIKSPLKTNSRSTCLVIIAFLFGCFLIPTRSTNVLFSMSDWEYGLYTFAVSLIISVITFLIIFNDKKRQYKHHLILVRKRLSLHVDYRIMTPRQARGRIIEESLGLPIFIFIALCLIPLLGNTMSMHALYETSSILLLVAGLLFMYTVLKDDMTVNSIKASKGMFTFYRSNPSEKFPDMLRFVPHSDMIPKQTKEGLRKEDKKAK